MTQQSLFPCPCCGYKTIGDSFDICCVCHWEHDPVKEETPDEEGGANGICLREAQRNFERFGACSEACIEHERTPTSEVERDPNWKPLGSGPYVLTCPCCGYKTITREHNTCAICRWQHVMYRNENVDEDGGPTTVSLREAQQNFLKFGAKTKNSAKYARKPTAQDERDLYWKPWN